MRIRYALSLIAIVSLATLPFTAAAQRTPELPSGTLSISGNQLSPEPHGVHSGSHLTTGAAYVSPILEASAPFSLAGPFWKPSASSGEVSVALRASIDGVAWSEWVSTGHSALVEAENGLTGLATGGWSAEPVLFGRGNRFIQVRVASADGSAGTPDLDKLSVYYIDSAPGPDGPDAAHEQRFAEERVAFEQSASMQVAAPRIYARSEWGARSPRSSWSYTTATHLAMHHSASTADGNADTWSECAAAVRGVQNFHMNVNGWSDIGYNYLVCPTGDIFAGREDTNNSSDVVGAHDSRNRGSVGVNGLGYYHPPYNQSPTNAMIDGFADLFAWIADRRGIDPSGSSFYSAYGATMQNIYGHRQVSATACPGDGLFAFKPTVITRTEARLAGTTPGLTALWQRNGALGGRPSWFSSTSSTERGLTYARVGSQERLYVVSRGGGTSVRILNATTGSDVGTLSTSGISGGTFALNDIESSSDGDLFAANLTTNTIDTRFRVYRWSSESAAPVRVIDFRTWSTPLRLGDHITVTGSAADNSLTIYAPASGGSLRRRLHHEQRRRLIFADLPQRVERRHAGAEPGRGPFRQ